VHICVNHNSSRRSVTIDTELKFTMDVFLYNGELTRISDLEFIKFVDEEKSSDELLLVLTTPGGDPDAAYKIGRYVQHRYDNIRVLIPGWCKSAGTLLAIAANELAFCPYGELGPLDVQLAKTDHIAGLDSGLNITDALLTLEDRARDTFHNLVIEIISGSGGVIAFQTASHSAAEIVSSLYGPVFGKFDPEEVGSRARAMRIGEDYAKRLNNKFSNLKDNAIEVLSRSYSSHSFVIDMLEASALFRRVEEANEKEKIMVDRLGTLCRMPNSKTIFRNLTDLYNEEPQLEELHDEDVPERETADTKSLDSPKAVSTNGKDTSGASAA